MLPKNIIAFREILLLSFFLCQGDAFLVDDGIEYLKIAAFNIQTFGVTKMSRPPVRKNIVKIMTRYDVVFVQEIRDSSLTAVNQLLSCLQDVHSSWTFVSSAPTGRNTYKEQYAFFYKNNSLSVLSSYQIPDPRDIYEREPYAVKVKYYSKSRSENRYVILSGVHIKPSDAKIELGEVDDSMKELDKHWSNTDGVIMMGDFNADCNYLTCAYRESLIVFNSPDFQSLIDHDADTTVRDTDCAYDRIVVYGDEIDARDAKVFDFKTALSLTQSEAEDVSDHFPVEFKLY